MLIMFLRVMYFISAYTLVFNYLLCLRGPDGHSKSRVYHPSKLYYLALQVVVLICATFDVKKQEGHPVAKSGTFSFAVNVRLIEAFANACGYALIFIQAVINDFTS